MFSYFAAKSTTNYWWVSIVVGLVSAMATVIGVYLKWYLEQKSKSKEDMGEYIKTVNEIYYTLAKYLDLVGASRVMIIKSENGGGKPKPGCQLYTSVVYESHNPPLKSIMKDWQRRLVDPAYIEFLSKVYLDKEAVLFTNELSEGILKNLYLSQNIKKSIIKSVYSDPTVFIYMSIVFTEDLDLDDPSIKLNVDLLQQKISTLLQHLDEIMDKEKK